MVERLIRRLRLIEPRDRLVRVKSWWPHYDGRYWCWPVMLIDQYGYQRCSVAPCWNRNRLRALLKGTSDNGQG